MNIRSRPQGLIEYLRITCRVRYPLTLTVPKRADDEQVHQELDGALHFGIGHVNGPCDGARDALSYGYDQ
jgi:hypothetical protein